MKIVNILFLLCCFSFCYAQDEAVIKQIDKKCTKLGNSIKSFYAKTVEDYKEPIGSGDATGYYKEGKLQMIVAEYTGKTDRVQAEYYFDNTELMFVYTEDTFYAAGALQGKDETAIWYFHNSKLIRWVGKDGKQVEPDSEAFLKSELDEQKEVQRLIRLLK